MTFQDSQDGLRRHFARTKAINFCMQKRGCMRACMATSKRRAENKVSEKIAAMGACLINYTDRAWTPFFARIYIILGYTNSQQGHYHGLHVARGRVDSHPEVVVRVQQLLLVRRR